MNEVVVLTPERILEVTEDVLRRYGLAKATVVDVARALDVSHGSVYRHFPSKASLREAVAKRWLDRASAPLLEITEATGPAPRRSRPRGLLLGGGALAVTATLILLGARGSCQHGPGQSSAAAPSAAASPTPAPAPPLQLAPPRASAAPTVREPAATVDAAPTSRNKKKKAVAGAPAASVEPAAPVTAQPQPRPKSSALEEWDGQ